MTDSSDKHTTVLLGATVALLLLIAIPMGVGIATTTELFFGPYTYHLFIILTVAIVVFGAWFLIRLSRELKRRGRLARSIAFVIYLVVVVVVGVDLALELFPRLIPPRVMANLPYGGNFLFPQGTATHEYRKDLMVKARPNAVVEIFYVNDLVRHGQISPIYDYPTTHILFATDSQGFRNQDDATTADIVVLGDSFTELPYMNVENIWTNLVARRTGLSIRNLGVSCYGTLQEAEVLRQWGLGYRPRVVVLAFYEGNDIFDCEEFERFRQSGLSYPVWAARQYPTRLGWLDRRPVMAMLRMALLPYQRMAERWSGQDARTASLRRAYFNPLELEAGGQRQKIGLLSFNLMLLNADREKVRSQRGWTLCREAIAQMKRRCDEAGAKLAVVLHPDQRTSLSAAPSRRIHTRGPARFRRFQS